jgi:thioredoxin reductase
MAEQKVYDVIIVGGSYAGLSAAMALGRALRKVLVIDSGKPCNRQTPHSHNFITHDGETPSAISGKAKEQVMRYPTVAFVDGKAISGRKIDGRFEIDVDNGEQFTAKKILFTTGLEDIMPGIEGFAECWGISVLHCPYCHGYEVRHQPTGIIANGDMGFELGRLINNWTNELTLFTNGPSSLAMEQRRKIGSHGIEIIETEIQRLEHEGGYVRTIQLKDEKKVAVKAVYTRPAFVQHCSIPVDLGCELTEQNLLKVDMFQRTTVPGIYAAGDNTTMMRSVSLAVAGGGFAGASINKDLIEEMF